MWIFKKKDSEQSWTCSDSSLCAVAHIQATDRNDAIKEAIINNDIAKDYLESLGFVVEYVPDAEPLTEIPKVANWYDRTHRELYDKLFYQKMDRPLTEVENEFVKQMYHMEEVACGLDGDRC